MKLPRGMSGAGLVKARGRLGYETTRQMGTLAGILSAVAETRDLDRDELIRQLFD